MMRTNTRKYLSNLDTYIYECIDTDNEQMSLLDKVNYFMSEFDRVANHEYNLRKFPNIIDRMDDYMQGLPFSFPFYYHDILIDVAKLHEIELIPADKEKVIIKNFNKHIANRILKIARG